MINAFLSPRATKIFAILALTEKIMTERTNKTQRQKPAYQRVKNALNCSEHVISET